MRAWSNPLKTVWGTGAISEQARQITSDVCRLLSTEQSHDQEQASDTFGYRTV